MRVADLITEPDAGNQLATHVVKDGVVVIIALDDAIDAKWSKLKMYDYCELVDALPATRSVSRNVNADGLGDGQSGGSFSLPSHAQISQPKQNVDEAKAALSESELLDQQLAKTPAKDLDKSRS